MLKTLVVQNVPKVYSGLWTVDCGLWNVGRLRRKPQEEPCLTNAGENARAQNCPLSTVKNNTPLQFLHCCIVALPWEGCCFLFDLLQQSFGG